MDRRKSLTNNRAKENSGGPSRLSESNIVHLSVQTTSPFLNRMNGTKHTNTEHGNNIVDRNIQTHNMFSKKLTSKSYSAISEVFINEIINKTVFGQNDSSYDIERSSDKEQKGKINKLIENKAEFTHSTQSFNSNYFSTQFNNSEKDTKKFLIYLLKQNQESVKRTLKYGIDEVTTTESFTISDAKISQSIMSEKKYKEKMTYCRPVHNFYNQELIYKTMQRNDRLQKIVKKLAIARQKEKQSEAWNNYINDLKNRQLYNNKQDKMIYQNDSDEREYSDVIKGYYGTEDACKQSNPCRNLLRDVYENCNTFSTNNFHKDPNFHKNENGNTVTPCHYSPYLYENNSDCYPMSSQGRLILLNREAQRNQFVEHWENRPASGRYHQNTIIVDPNLYKTRKRLKSFDSKRSPTTQNQLNCSLKSLSIQTDNTVIPFSQVTEHKCINTEKETLKDRYNAVADNVERLRQKIYGSQKQPKCNSLASIESKLDILIKSINTFMLEVKAKNNLDKGNKISASVSCKSSSTNNKINIATNDPFGIIKTEQIICGMVCNKSGNNIAISEFQTACRSKKSSNLDKMLIEELDKSDKVKKDIDDILNGQTSRPCAVQISFDIPTRDRSTEVTKSLSKAKVENIENEIIEEIATNGSRHEKRMTIAVNTEPLGLLALLRVSRETIRQILSYMPNIPYQSYFSTMTRPQLQRSCTSHYVCNICGAAFEKPSQLSDHIRSHNLGETRDCCVCRHILDVQRRSSPGLFACRYCGQRFTRAYCCELHQESCARRLGKRHDIDSSLMLLK